MSIIIITITTTTTTIIITISTITIIISCYNTQLSLAFATTRTSIRDTTQLFFLYLLLYLFNNFLWLHPSLRTSPSNQKPICANLHACSIAPRPQITSSLSHHLILVSTSIVPSLSNSPFCLHSCFVNSEDKKLIFRPSCLVFLEKIIQFSFNFSFLT